MYDVKLKFYVFRFYDFRMTFDSALYDVLLKTLNNDKRWPWFCKSTQQHFPVYNFEHSRIKAEVVIYDAPGHLKRTYKTFRELINLIKYDLDLLMKKPGVAHLHYVMDQDTPISKYADEGDKAHVPHTPLEEFSTTDPMKAWEMFLNKQTRVSARDQLNSISPNPLPFDYVFPENLSAFLENRDFKKTLAKKVCDTLLHEYVPPTDKRIYIYGPDFCRGRDDKSEFSVPEVFRNKYCEADFQTVWIANQYHHTHHVTIYSRDGDVVMANLLAQTDRIITIRGKTVDSVQFAGQIVVVRHWMEKDIDLAWIDINNLWSAITDFATEKKRCFPNTDFEFKNAVHTIVALCLFLKNDYVQNCPRLGPVYLFRGFFSNLGIIRLPLVKNVTNQHTLKFDATSFLVTVFLGYFKAFPGKIPNGEKYLEEPDMAFKMIQKALQSEATKFTMETFKVKLANVYWFMQYMMAAQHGELPPDPLTQTRDKISMYGYQNLSPPGPVANGRPIVKRPSKVSINWFIF